MTDETKAKLKQELDVINAVQHKWWFMHHEVIVADSDLGMKVWQLSLQTESALLHINEDILGGNGYYGEGT